MDSGVQTPGPGVSIYSPAQFEKDLAAMKPRLFDTYILPAFLCLYAIKDKGMRVNARRMLFIAGIYMGYLNYNKYKDLILSLKNISA